MKTRLIALVCACVAVWCCPKNVSGEVVTFNFIGDVYYVYNPFGVVSPSLVHVGDPVQASLQYDTSNPDLYPEANRGSFTGPGSLKVTINGRKFERTDTIQIDILHGANGGQEYFEASAHNSPTAWPAEIPTYPYQTIGLLFWETGPPHDFLSSAELPTSLDFSRADMIFCSISTATQDLNMYEIQFHLVQNQTPAPPQVPEPTGALLLTVGFLLYRFRFHKINRSVEAPRHQS